MNNPVWRGRFVKLCLACGTVLTVGGCGLSDRQLTSILQATIQSALSTAVNSAISNVLTLPTLVLQALTT